MSGRQSAIHGIPRPLLKMKRPVTRAGKRVTSTRRRAILRTVAFMHRGGRFVTNAPFDRPSNANSSIRYSQIANCYALARSSVRCPRNFTKRLLDSRFSSAARSIANRIDAKRECFEMLRRTIREKDKACCCCRRRDNKCARETYENLVCSLMMH